MRTLYILNVFLHITAAVTWVGGMLFLSLVVVPSIRRPELRGQSLEILRQTGRRFRTVGHISLGVLILTGAANLWFRGWWTLSPDFWGSGYGHMVGGKILLVIGIFGLSMAHDFLVGPRALEAGKAGEAAYFRSSRRRWAGWMGRLNLVFGLAAVFIGILLVRGLPF